jgi:putative acetyltransferase
MSRWVVSTSETPVRVRSYKSADAAETLRIFHNAVTVTAAADYTPEQVAAWAQIDKRDLGGWDRAMLARESYVALIGEDIAGFSDVSVDGYVDMMFVSPRFARRGVARNLLTYLEALAQGNSAKRLSANVSITARPFFEAMGFRVETEQHPVTGGVIMTNFHMTKEIDWTDGNV